VQVAKAGDILQLLNLAQKRIDFAHLDSPFILPILVLTKEGPTAN